MRMTWIPSPTGYHWHCNDYVISTESGGGQPSGYILLWRRQPVGARYVTFDAAAAAALGHAEALEPVVSR